MGSLQNPWPPPALPATPASGTSLIVPHTHVAPHTLASQPPPSLREGLKLGGSGQGSWHLSLWPFQSRVTGATGESPPPRPPCRNVAGVQKRPVRGGHGRQPTVADTQVSLRAQQSENSLPSQLLCLHHQRDERVTRGRHHPTKPSHPFKKHPRPDGLGPGPEGTFLASGQGVPTQGDVAPQGVCGEAGVTRRRQDQSTAHTIMNSAESLIIINSHVTGLCVYSILFIIPLGAIMTSFKMLAVNNMLCYASCGLTHPLSTTSLHCITFFCV